MIPPFPSSSTFASLLVLGGARSGKSHYVQALAEQAARHPHLIATAEAKDDEMRDRILRHREERPAHWSVSEVPLALCAALEEHAAPEVLLVVDCLTLWLSNLMMTDETLDTHIKDLVTLVPHLAGPVVFVSNEVGLGIVPDNAMARHFRDAQGRLNQRLAAQCEAVVLVCAGIPQLIKPGQRPHITF